MTACPAEDELVRMVEGALGDASLAAIERHVDGCEACAAVVAGLGALANGAQTAARTVGRYQLDRRIGAGGMGEVWAGWDPELRRDVAIKLVQPDRVIVPDGDPDHDLAALSALVAPIELGRRIDRRIRERRARRRAVEDAHELVDRVERAGNRRLERASRAHLDPPLRKRSDGSLSQRFTSPRPRTRIRLSSA